MRIPLFGIPLAASLCLLSQTPQPMPEQAVRAAVDAYHQAFERKDTAALEKLFHPDLLVFEGGGVDRGAKAYLEHHLGPELKELKSWTNTGMEIQVQVEGAMAYATCAFTYEAAFTNGKMSRGKATESLVLVKADGGWRIRHLHWSSHAIKPSKS